MITAVPAEHIDRLWPEIGAGVQRCLDKAIGRWSAQDVYNKVAAGKWLLFIIDIDGKHAATIICHVEDYANMRTFEIGMAWGEGLATWSDELDELTTRIARELGCDQMTVTGRRGWAKHLLQYGYREAMTIMNKEL